MKRFRITLQPIDIRLYLWGSTAITLILTSLLSWWLLSAAWSGWHNARNSIIQFDSFYHVLLVSNDLASERAFANELVLSSYDQKKMAGKLLDESRQKTDRDLKMIPKNLLSPKLLAATFQQLKPARIQVDRFRQEVLSDPDIAQQAIDSMVAATDFYHEALFRHTSEFLKLDPSALGPILRSQALGELRDATGRLGSQLLIPLATQTPIQIHAIESLSQGKERIRTLWLIMHTYGNEDIYIPEFRLQVADTRKLFETQGEVLISKLLKESLDGTPYSVSAGNFARYYHASLNPFNELLDTYLTGVKMYYIHVEWQALLHLIAVSVILVVLILLAIGTILFIRNRMLRPMMHLNQIATDIVTGNRFTSKMNKSSAEEVHALFTSLGALNNKLQEQITLSEQFQRQSEEDSLTKLFNRRAFDDKVNKLLKLNRPEYRVCLIMIDVDHFKSINDTWGHPTGDNVLVQLATILKKTSRVDDVVGRLGGEEFAVAFCSNDKQEAYVYATRIQNAIRQQCFEGPKGETFFVTASFGVASGWQQELKEILALADIALYDAKKNGRDRIVMKP